MSSALRSARGALALATKATLTPTSSNTLPTPAIFLNTPRILTSEPKSLKVSGPSNRQHVSAEVVAGNDLLDVVRTLKIDREAPGLREVVINGPGNERPGKGAVGRRLAGERRQARRAVEIPREAQAEALDGFRLYSCLPDAVHFLVSQEIGEGQRAADVLDVAGGEEAAVGEPCKNREPLVQRVGERSGGRANITLEVGVDQPAVRDAHLVFQGNLLGGLEAKHQVRALPCVGRNRRVGGAVGKATKVAADAEDLRRLIANADLRRHGLGLEGAA